VKIYFNHAKHKTVLLEAGRCKLGLADDVKAALRYHTTNVVELLNDGSVRLNSGGWRTNTTKKRVNKALDAWGFSDHGIYQHDFEWYVRTPNGDIEFEENMVLRRAEQQEVAA